MDLKNNRERTSLVLENHSSNTTDTKINKTDSTLVTEMLQKSAIYEVPVQPCLISRIFEVSKSDGSHRLVVALTHLNSLSFSMTNHNTVRQIIDLPSWMASLDFKDAFLHI